MIYILFLQSHQFNFGAKNVSDFSGFRLKKRNAITNKTEGALHFARNLNASHRFTNSLEIALGTTSLNMT